jgi:hypothetical protein
MFVATSAGGLLIHSFIQKPGVPSSSKKSSSPRLLLVALLFSHVGVRHPNYNP